MIHKQQLRLTRDEQRRLNRETVWFICDCNNRFGQDHDVIVERMEDTDQGRNFYIRGMKEPFLIPRSNDENN